MAVKIRLKRMGKIRPPYYRIVVADSRTKRDGRVIEEIGKYHPKEEPSLIEVESERAQYWLGVGAQPTEAVAAILKVTGDWQKFKGEAGAEGTLKVKPEGKTKQEIFNEILKESGSRGRRRGRDARRPPRRRAKAAKAEPEAEPRRRPPRPRPRPPRRGRGARPRSRQAESPLRRRPTRPAEAPRRAEATADAAEAAAEGDAQGLTRCWPRRWSTWSAGS